MECWYYYPLMAPADYRETAALGAVVLVLGLLIATLQPRRQ